VIERKDNRTKIIFMPITGRTHQLRVHAAHQDGLNASILGDDIYGRQMNRLHLQAYYLEFLHPSTFEVMKFELEPEF
jgi:tRNA pseudouridine32 synthase/23S rRNA pseudouridine746 synthase